jgi:hypothetical protein
MTKPQLAKQIGRDGQELITRLAEPDTPTGLATLKCVEILRTVWSQQYHITEGDGTVTV